MVRAGSNSLRRSGEAMPLTQDKSFNDLVEHFLEMRLPRQMAEAIALPDLPPDTQKFIMRMLALMKRAGYSASGFNPPLLHWLATTIPSVLPSAWGGRIPPITLPGRHRKLDDYVANQHQVPEASTGIFIDVGCGFPPVTTAETAACLPNWQVYGVDRSFAEYVLYDSEGHYACFGRKGVFQYFQALMNASGRALYADPASARARFEKLFAELVPLLQDSDGTASKSVERDGNKLIHHYIRNFESDNLTFIQSDIGEADLPLANVMRCMNLLIYFKPEIGKKMLQDLGELLEDEGILIVGTNGLGIQSRYAIYQKGRNGIRLREFAFGLDNLGHITFMPWFTIHENDSDALMLAKLTGTIRANQQFWDNFSNRLDELLQYHDICERGSDGFLHFYQEAMPPNEYIEKNANIWQQMTAEGFLERAVDALKQAGYNAWQNSVNDIAVQPSAEELGMH